MSSIGILGAGTWGCALAILLAGKGHDVTIWTKIENEARTLNENRTNMRNLPGAQMPEEVKITLDLKEACTDKDCIVTAVASPYIRTTAKEASPYIKKGQVIVNVSKGIEDKTLYTLSEVIHDEIPQADIVVLSGPSHAEEVSRGVPTAIVVGADTMETAHFIQDIFITDLFRVYTSPDVIGIELGGSLKNVIALAAGIVDGLGYGDNTKAALMTRGMAEIARLGIEMGGKMETFFGLSGFGDLFVTCTSKHSRNWNAGNLIGQGKTMEEATQQVGQVVEGINSAKAALSLAQKYNLEMPIVEQINKILFEGKTARDAINDLLNRKRRKEYTTLEWD